MLKFVILTIHLTQMNFLIIEDHPLTTAVYSSILLEDKALNTHIVMAYDCKQAYHSIMKARHDDKPFDLAIIDYNLPPYHEENLLSGADLALLIKKNFENCKIIIITSHSKILIIYDLIRRINPQGLASKSDISTDNLIDIIKEVLNGKLYKSPQINACVEEIWTKDLIFDDYNRKILRYLAKGYKIKDLEEVIMLSKSAINKRIIKLKKTFNAEDEKELLRKVFEQNFL